MNETAASRPLSRDLPCPACLHSHCWLPCDDCDCTEHWQLGTYPDASASPSPA